jgi:hypothetical protein
MVLVLYTLHALSPTLIWHCNLLAQLLAQFHADKQRALALKQLSYMQAIHETGARLTHDVKNLLQSLNAVCSAGAETGAVSSPAYQALLRRQLPAISERLGGHPGQTQCAAGLSTERSIPGTSGLVAGPAPAHGGADSGSVSRPTCRFEWRTAGRGFSGVIDNLVRNLAEKHLLKPELRVDVELKRSDGGFELIVCDDGSAMAGPGGVQAVPGTSILRKRLRDRSLPCGALCCRRRVIGWNWPRIGTAGSASGWRRRR